MPAANPPYVVTDDLELVFDDLSMLGDRKPDKAHVEEASNRIISSLDSIFPKVERIPASRIAGYLEDRVEKSSLPVVSLTALLPASERVISLEFSRSAKLVTGLNGDFNFEDVGLLPRFQDRKCINHQFEDVAQIIQACGVREVTIADDVVFSGGTVLDVVEKLAAFDIAVRSILASVSMKKAVARLGVQNIAVESDFVYEDVIDEVCMRDFIVGAPGGGRNIVREDGSYAAAPYINPFGSIENWASIDIKDAPAHSKACLEAAAKLWQAIDAHTETETRFSMLPKPVLFCNDNDGIANKIEQCLTRGRYAARTYSL